MDLEQKLTMIADKVHDLPDGKPLAQQLIACAGELRDYTDRRRDAAYAAYQNAFAAWSEFQKSTAEAEYARQDALITRERTRILLRVSASPQWQGRYEELRKLVED